MEDQNDYNEALLLIVDEFEGIITDEQLQTLQRWRLQSKENERIYQEFHSIKIEVDALVNLKELNVDDSWSKVDAELIDDPKVVPLANENNLLKEKGNSKFWISIAASVALLIGFYLYQQSTAIQTLATAKGTYLRFTLPDGSFIALNEDTEVQYSSVDFAEKRIIRLNKGEAYLQVKHNSLRPFKVLAGDAIVEDIGTAFSVIKGGNSVKVFVTSGKVMLSSSGSGSSKLILPQHTAEFQSDTKSLNEVPSKGGQLNWLQQSLSFNNADLSDVITKLERVYNARIDLGNPDLGNRKLTANLSYQTLDSALSVVSASLQLKVNASSGKYTLTN